MRAIINRLILLSLLSSFVGFIIVFAFVAIGSVPEGLLEDFRLSWIFSESFTVWIDYFIPAIMVAIVIVFSFTGASDEGLRADDKRKIASLLRMSFLTVFFLYFLYTISALVAVPALENSNEQITRQSERVLGLEAMVEEAEAEGRLIDALSSAMEILSTVGENEQRLMNIARIRSKIANQQGIDLDTEVMTQQQPQERGLLEQARKYFEAGDLFTALYFAERAANFERGAGESARILIQEIDQAMSLAELSLEEESDLELFQLKEAAYEAYEARDAFQAFFILNQLSEQFPNDSDVKRWLPVYAQAVEEQSFDIGSLPQGDDVVDSLGPVLLTVGSGQDGNLIFLAASQVFWDGFSLFLRDVQVFSGVGSLVSLSQTPWAVVRGNYLYGRSYDRELNVEVGRFTLIQGSEPLVQFDALPLARRFSFEELALLSRDFETMGLSQLLRYNVLAEQFGYGTKGVEAEIVRQLVEIAFGPVFLLIWFGFSWRYRSRYYLKPPGAMFLGLPLIVLGSVLIWETYRYVVALVVAAVFSLIGFAATIVLGAVFLGIFLFASLFYVVIQVRNH